MFIFHWRLWAAWKSSKLEIMVEWVGKKVEIEIINTLRETPPLTLIWNYWTYNFLLELLTLCWIFTILLWVSVKWRGSGKNIVKSILLGEWRRRRDISYCCPYFSVYKSVKSETLRFSLDYPSSVRSTWMKRKYPSNFHRGEDSKEETIKISSMRKAFLSWEMEKEREMFAFFLKTFSTLQLTIEISDLGSKSDVILFRRQEQGLDCLQIWNSLQFFLPIFFLRIEKNPLTSLFHSTNPHKDSYQCI